MESHDKCLRQKEINPNIDNREPIFELIMMTGKILLQNGAEIYRVEETMRIIANHFHIYNIDIFAISNGIFMTMEMDGCETRTAQIKYIPISPVHLGRVTAVNNLSRAIVAGQYTINEALNELQKISSIPYESNILRIIFAGVGSASFCYLLGGNLYDSLTAFISGLFLYIYVICTEKAKIPSVLNNALGSALVTIISVILFRLGFGNNLDHIIIGSIICLVPGVAFTTSVRDYFNGDYLSGTIHLVDALLVATSISIGVGVIMTLYNFILGG